MDFQEMLIGFVAGTVPSILPLFRRTKKDSDQILLELIKVLRDEISRVRTLAEESNTEVLEMKQKYETLQKEYDTLLGKYNSLKKDFTDYKNKQQQ